MLEMNPNLVGSTGQKAAKYHAVVVDLFNYLKLCMRRPTLGDNRHLFSMEWIASDWFLNVAALLSKHSGANRQVDFFDLPVRELLAQPVVDLVVLCDDQTATGPLVQTMDNSRPEFATDPTETRTMIEQRVNQGPFSLPCARMNHQAGGFIDHGEELVLEKEGNRDGF